MLQPHHFLPDNSLLPLYPRQRDQGLKHYKMAADRVLREQTGDVPDTVPKRFPPFRFIGTRSQVGHTVNPFLVILAAEIKFRRYLAADGPQLPPVYDSLMRKTIQVADLLYFLPADRGSAFRDPVLIDMEAFHSPVDFVDAEMGFRTGADESTGSTARQQRRTGAGGGGTRRADNDYWRHMLSGRGSFRIFFAGSLTDCEYSLVDLELNNDDLDVLREMQESNRGGQHSQFQVDSSSLTLHSHLQSRSNF